MAASDTLIEFSFGVNRVESSATAESFFLPAVRSLDFDYISDFDFGFDSIIDRNIGILFYRYTNSSFPMPMIEKKRKKNNLIHSRINYLIF